MNLFRHLLFGAVLAVLLTTTTAWAQLSTAQLSGRVAHMATVTLGTETPDLGGALATLSSAQFGRILTQAGTPRIIQLGVKSAF